ncbi:protein Star-like [Neocloeon triangulifer]|uniref:protein Star-like n=1 Tax=Neocloeon triangulifer TaxID=2078957 RepID=UPI00286EF288|nr:protein Star-like [Neocloeon triangulifer]
MQEILKKERVLNETAKSMEGLDQFDAKLVQYTRDTILIPPEEYSANDTTSRLLIDEKYDPSVMQVASKIIKLLKHRKNGFVVECGVWDGIAQSNSLLLEIFYNWTSLLIEAAPTEVRKVEARRNRAWIAPACLSTKPFSNTVKFLDHSMFGMIVGPTTNLTEKDKTLVHNVLCIPFMTFMQALNRTSIDYFSLDVEGSEMEILPLIDFEKIKIDVMTIEHQLLPGKLGKMVNFMAAKNFTLHSATLVDFIFVNNRLGLT